MTLQEIFDALSYGELQQISIGGQEAGIIDETNSERVIDHINLGLTALYKRFSLKEDRVTFPLEAGGYTYVLQVVDLLKITRVFTHTEVELPLNDENDRFSCFTPSAKTLVVPKILVDKTSELPSELNTYELTAVYRANHPKVVKRLGFFDPSRTKLELPDEFKEPLLYFVAARMLMPMGAGPLEGGGGMNYIQRYEMACKLLENQTSEKEVTQQNTRLRGRGFV